MSTLHDRATMTVRLVGPVVVVGALAFLGLSTPGTNGQANAARGPNPQYQRIYHKQPVALTLDAGRVAVFDDAAPEAAMAPYGIAPDGIERLEITGWSLADVPAAARNAAGVESLVGTIARDRAADFVSPVFVDDLGGPLIVTPDILVGFHRHLTAAQAEHVLDASGAGVITDVDYAGMSRVYRLRSTSRSGLDVLEAANALALRPEVKFAEPDMIFTGRNAVLPDDTGFPNCWGLHNVGPTPDNDMDAPQAWDITTGDPAVIVVVIDNGVQQDHYDINQMPGHDVTNQSLLDLEGGPVNECDNHGTAVAGCVTGKINGVGTVGIAPDCTVASCRTFIAAMTCTGSWFTNSSWTVDALQWAVDIGARVTCNSNIYGFTSAAIEQMYEDTYSMNQIVHFAANGNAGNPAIAYPASIDIVNGVAALTMNGELASFSNYGPGTDFAAPGHRIFNADRTGPLGNTRSDFTHGSGTSFAAPYCAGVAALVISNFPAFDAAAVEFIMQAGAQDLGDPGYDTTYGWGFVNAWCSLSPACTPDVETCGPGAGDCATAHGGLGCDDAGCCTYVCQIDPNCCDVSWDQSCADAALACAPPAGTTERISLSSTETEGNNNSFWPRIAADAPHIVAFDSRANFDGDNNGTTADVFVRDTDAGTTTRISNPETDPDGNGNSWLCDISPDGRWVAFYSYASNMVDDDTNTVGDCFVHDRDTGETVRVSVNAAGEEGNNRSVEPSITPDGRFVAFHSYANNLVAGDTNGRADVFVHDRDFDNNGIFDEPGGTHVELVSMSTGGAQGDEHTNDDICPHMSADGRHVIFASPATTLVSGDTNGAFDVFAHDRLTHTTVRISVSAAGVEANSHSVLADVTPDGRFVVFNSGADNLVDGDTNGVNDVFVHDRDPDLDGIFDEPGEIAVERATVSSGGVQNNGGSGFSAITPDGRYVAFNSAASNLVPVDFNYQPDVFVRDRTAGETTMASVATAGQPDERSFWPHLSADGRYVAFHSYATNLVAGDTNGFRDVFRRDRGAPLVTCIGDLDHDGTIGIPDLLALQTAWGTSPGGPPDLDGDGLVGILDLLELLGNWGACQ